MPPDGITPVDHSMELPEQSETGDRQPESLLSHVRPLMSLSDEQAMRRVQADGDRRAFGLLVRRWREPIRRLCTRMTGDPHRGEDLAQETFARLLERAASYRHDARFSTFLWRVAVNLCLDERRRMQRRPESPLDAGEERGAAAHSGRASSELSPPARLARRERAEGVKRALSRLPETYRAVVVLRHYEGLKFREIAEVLSIPLGTVKSRMAEALNRLARMLSPDLAEETP